METRLYHLSERPDIARFEPRPPPGAEAGTAPLVWAIDERHLRNYLVPRDCPRVTFAAAPGSDPADVARLLAGTSAGAVVAIEAGWLPALRSCRLYRYAMPPATFALADAAAGYYTSRAPVTPLGVESIDDLLGELLRQDVELRVMPSLWKLYDAVAASTLEFSIIRMRNARPREE